MRRGRAAPVPEVADDPERRRVVAQALKAVDDGNDLEGFGLILALALKRGDNASGRILDGRAKFRRALIVLCEEVQKCVAGVE